jgi:hypothetical protein
MPIVVETISCVRESTASAPHATGECNVVPAAVAMPAMLRNRLLEQPCCNAMVDPPCELYLYCLGYFAALPSCSAGSPVRWECSDARDRVPRKLFPQPCTTFSVDAWAVPYLRKDSSKIWMQKKRRNLVDLKSAISSPLGLVRRRLIFSEQFFW